MILGGREFVFTGVRPRQGSIHGERNTRRPAQSKPRTGRTTRIWDRWLAGDAICSALDEAHYLHAWDRCLGAARGLAQVCAGNANLVLAPSRDNRRARFASEQRGPRASGIRVLPWALDPQFEALLAAGAKAAIPPEGFPAGRVILTVARWLAHGTIQGLMDTLIIALPRLLASCRNCN